MERILTCLPVLRKVVDEAVRGVEWIVVVVPDQDAGTVLRLLYGIAVTGSTSAGRSVLLPDGGRVTVVPLHDEEFDGHGYRQVMLGCEDATSPSDVLAVHRWLGERSSVGSK
jgi:hypothetical protein